MTPRVMAARMLAGLPVLWLASGALYVSHPLAHRLRVLAFRIAGIDPARVRL